LTPAAIQHLTVLAANQLHPSSELLKTWTALLASSGAIEQDVINWIRHRNQHTRTSSDATSPSQAQSSTSPISPTSPGSPPLAYNFKLKQETIGSPAALLSHTDEHEDPVPPSSPTSPTSNHELLNQRIIHGVRDALASTDSETTAMPNAPAAPKTAADFEALFSPFEKQMVLLIHTLEST
jgi:hypothetical protein